MAIPTSACQSPYTCAHDLQFASSHRTLSNVFSFVAAATNYTNLNVSSESVLTNATGTISGPLNPNQYVPFTAPNTSAIGAGGGPVFVSPGMNTSFTAAVAPAPVNLTQENKTLPWSGPRNGSNTDTTNSGSGKKSGAADMREGIVVAAIFGTIVAGVAALLI